MLKHLLNKILIIFSIFVLSLSSIATEVETVPPVVDVSANESMELVQNEVTLEDPEIEPINTQVVKKDIVPDSKKEGKKVIKLFLKTMMAVAVSAIILYFILLFVKKFYSKSLGEKETTQEIEILDLATPTTKQEAFKSFLNKSK